MKSFLSLCLFLSFALTFSASASLPATLKVEPQQRDPYNWQERHESVIKRHTTVKPEYVFIGDSIVHHWGGEPVDNFGFFGEDSWNKLFGSHKVTNMGFGFDYADNVYYRIMNGELNNTSPRVIILMIGTNNLGHRKDSPQACADNIKALVQLLREKSPKSKVLLVGVLPRLEPELAPVIEKTNELLAKLNNGKSVFFVNPGKSLLSPDGHLAQKNLMKDTVHLNKEGYIRLGSEIAEYLRKLDPAYKAGKVLPKPEKIEGIDPDKSELVLIGDSITDNYRKNQPPNQAFLPTWKKFYSPLNAINFGISGNKTDDILNRIDAGILDYVNPRVAVVLIGTNNTGTGQGVAETEDGIKKVVAKVRSKLPNSRILLVGILPSDIRDWHVAAAKYPEKKAEMDREINGKIAKFYKNDPVVTFLDISKVFLKKDGKINEDLFYDPKEVNFLGRKCGPLHPDTKGQRLMAEAIHPTLMKLMRKSQPKK